MAAATQEEADAVVADIRKLVAELGQSSPRLAEVRKWYSVFHRCPEHGSLVALEAAIADARRTHRDAPCST